MSNIERRREQALNVRPVVRRLPSAAEVQEQDCLTWGDKRLDRVQESHHVVLIRQHEREAVEGAAREARDAFIDMAAVEARRRVNTEMKEQLLRANRETQIMAGEDAELRAKFSLLDDDLFQFARLRGLR